MGPLIAVGLLQGEAIFLETSCATPWCVGLEKVTLNEAERTVAFSMPGMYLDFRGIGKGLALDIAAK